MTLKRLNLQTFKNATVALGLLLALPSLGLRAADPDTGGHAAGARVPIMDLEDLSEDLRPAALPHRVLVRDAGFGMAPVASFKFAVAK